MAAAVAYGAGRSRDSDLILVFDLGAGTYDVSLVSDFEGIMEVVATDGDGFLGGDDMDAALIGYCQRLAGSAAWSLLEQQDLRGRCIDAKLLLSSRQSADIEVPGLGRVTVTRSEFEALCEPLRARMFAPLQRLGREAKITWREEPWADPSTAAEGDRQAHLPAFCSGCSGG